MVIDRVAAENLVELNRSGSTVLRLAPNPAYPDLLSIKAKQIEAWEIANPTLKRSKLLFADLVKVAHSDHLPEKPKTLTNSSMSSVNHQITSIIPDFG